MRNLLLFLLLIFSNQALVAQNLQVKEIVVIWPKTNFSPNGTVELTVKGKYNVLMKKGTCFSILSTESQAALSHTVRFLPSNETIDLSPTVFRDNVTYYKFGIIPGLNEPFLRKMNPKKGKQAYETIISEGLKIKSINLDQEATVASKPSPRTINKSNDTVIDNNEGLILQSAGVAENISANNTSLRSFTNDQANDNDVFDDMVNLHEDKSSNNKFQKFYTMGGNLYDSDSDKIVAEGVFPGYGVIVNNDSFAIISDFTSYYHKLQIFDGDGTKKLSYDIEGFISPDCKYVISIKDGDLWRTDLEIEDGELQNERRLTQLGLFYRTFYHQHWYKDKIVFRPEGSSVTIGTQYEINTNSGVIINLHDKFGVEEVNVISPISGNDEMLRMDIADKSPSLRYAFTTLGRNSNDKNIFKLYDLKNGEFVPSNLSSEIYYWGSNNHIICKETNDEIPQLIIREVSSEKFQVLGRTHAWPRSREMMSANGEFFLWNRNDGYDKAMYVYSLENNTNDVLESNSSLVLADLTFKSKINSISWISNHEIIYVKGGDINNQGTWYYNARDKTKTKLFSFRAERIENIAGTNYTYIWTNNKLYKYNNVLKETKQIINTNRSIINSFRKINFLRALYKI